LTYVPSLNIQSEGFLGLLNELWQAPVFSGVVITGITIVVVSLLIPPTQHVLEMHRIELDKSLDNVGSKEELMEQSN